MAKKTKRKRKLVKGKDWHVWMPKMKNGILAYDLAIKCDPVERYPFSHYNWVKVKLVEVK